MAPARTVLEEDEDAQDGEFCEVEPQFHHARDEASDRSDERATLRAIGRFPGPDQTCKGEDFVVISFCYPPFPPSLLTLRRDAALRSNEDEQLRPAGIEEAALLRHGQAREVGDLARPADGHVKEAFHERAARLCRREGRGGQLQAFPGGFGFCGGGERSWKLCWCCSRSLSQ